MSERYELIERIAVGGMAEIFRANKIGAAGFSKPVAVKRILPHLASDSEFVDRFVAEAKISVTLAHPNIVSVFELNRFAGSLYIAMEFVDGPDLASLLSAARRSNHPIAIGPAVHIAGELLRGLEHAHSYGVIHRDVSPSNVLISRSGEVKITDFGIAKAGGFDLTNNRRVMGKWPYMSPEQTRGDELDSRADLFAAGAVIHELLCGPRLFRGESTSSIIAAIREQAIPPPSSLRPDLPPALDRVCQMLLERDRDLRAPDAGSVLAELSDIDLEISRTATSVGVASEIERLSPRADPPAAEPDALLDDIINSELAHARDGRRVTVQTDRLVGRQTEGLSFVRSDSDSGDAVGEWLLSDDSRTYTLNQTLQMFALPENLVPPAPDDHSETRQLRPASDPAPEPAPPEPIATPRRSKAPLVAALAIAAAIAVAVAAVLSRTEEPPAPPVDARSIATPADAAVASSSALVTVTSDPGGAEVTLGGEVIGVTPIVDRQAAPRDGVVELTIAKPGFLAATVKVELVAGARVRINRVLQPSTRTGAMEVRSTPPAEVYWRGKRIGRTPLRGLNLPVGTHTLVLVAGGQREEVEVTVPGDPVIDVTFR